MAKGLKTGGRHKGVPNKKTVEIAELLAKFRHNPIEAMVTIARDPKASLELKGKMNAELAQYIYPKRKAIDCEVSGKEGGGNAIVFKVERIGE